MYTSSNTGCRRRDVPPGVADEARKPQLASLRMPLGRLGRPGSDAIPAGPRVAPIPVGQMTPRTLTGF